MHAHHLGVLIEILLCFTRSGVVCELVHFQQAPRRCQLLLVLESYSEQQSYTSPQEINYKISLKSLKKKIQRILSHCFSWQRYLVVHSILSQDIFPGQLKSLYRGNGLILKSFTRVKQDTAIHIIDLDAQKIIRSPFPLLTVFSTSTSFSISTYILLYHSNLNCKSCLQGRNDESFIQQVN